MLQFLSGRTKLEAFKKVHSYLKEKGFTITEYDDKRPWGGFFVIDENQTSEFIRTFFSHLNEKDFEGYHKLSPKILLIAPRKRISWQYHHRRSEIWKVIGGNVTVVVSPTDQETKGKQLVPGDTVELKQGERHRLAGLDEWAVIAEIWKHINPEQPSDEEDIVRVQDDYYR